MHPIPFLLAFLLATALGAPHQAGGQAGAPLVVSMQICPSEPKREGCRTGKLEDVRLPSGTTWVTQTVHVPEVLDPLQGPMKVVLVAMASSEIYWNGVLIGKNGRPGTNRANEEPGRFIAAFVVPPKLVRPGPNILAARLSANHLWLPVRQPVHAFEVSYGHLSPVPGIMGYLPALLILGLMAAAGLYFGVAAASNRSNRNLAILAGIAVTGTLQLVAEVSRAFLSYSYPWHLGRLSLIAVFAGVTAVLVASYAARRFNPADLLRPVGLVATTSVICLLLAPTFDLKAFGPLLAGVTALTVCAWRGLRAKQPGAELALAGGTFTLGLMLWDPQGFLDRWYFIALAALLIAVIMEQLGHHQVARRERNSETRRAERLDHQLKQIRRDGGQAVIQLKDGAKIHRILEDEILCAKAADDYCELKLTGDRKLFVTISLSKLETQLPSGFIRTHKSYLANLKHVTAVAPRRNGGQLLTLSDRSEVPVGRTYRATIASTIGANTQP